MEPIEWVTPTLQHVGFAEAAQLYGWSVQHIARTWHCSKRKARNAKFIVCSAIADLPAFVAIHHVESVPNGYTFVYPDPRYQKAIFARYGNYIRYLPDSVTLTDLQVQYATHDINVLPPYAFSDHEIDSSRGTGR